MMRTALLALVLVTVGCSSAPHHEEDESDITENEADPNFRGTIIHTGLYASTTESAAPCDVFVAPIVRYTDKGVFLELQDKTEGPCAVGVPASKRTYPVQVTRECGSKTYKGENVELVDHIDRTCADGTSLILKLTETRDGEAVTSTSYEEGEQ